MGRPADTGNTMPHQEGVAAVDRALRVLGAFTPKHPILTLAELAMATGLYKSTILRICASLLNHGYLVRLRDGSYCLGPEALRMGMAYKKSFRLAEVVYTVLETLVDTVMESASYHVRDGDERVCVNRVESSEAVTDSLREGTRLPVDRGAGGRVFLAFSGEEGDRYDAIRRELMAVSLGECSPDTAAIAAPVFAPPDDGVIGIISVSGLITRFTEDRVVEMAPVVRRAAYELTRALGGDATPFVPFLSVSHRESAGFSAS